MGFCFAALLTGCSGQVNPGDTADLALGVSCAADADCSSGFCTEGKCSSCTAASDCPPTAACTYDDEAGHHVCTTGQGSVLGEPCGSGSDCASSLCFEDAAGGLCSTCETVSDCNGDEPCAIDTALGYARCQDGTAALGRPCARPADCASGHCRDDVCAECTDDGDCVDATCVFEATAGYAVCEPIPGLLGDLCTGDGDCGSGICFDPGGGFDSACSLCRDASACGTSQDCYYDAAIGYGTCRGALALGATCSAPSECLSGMCNATVCSVCETDADCFNELSCAYKNPEGYALCLDASEERVNADFSADDTYERVGCNNDCNGCVCDADADGAADGFCVGEDCVIPAWGAPVVLDCDVDDCTTTDNSRDAFTTCDGHSGLACVTALDSQATPPFYVQQGLCACFGGGVCQCQQANPSGGGDTLCLDNGVVFHETEAVCQVEGVPCDDTYVGNFDPDYGTVSGGACQPNVCTEPRVDIGRDGSFSWCGCDDNVRGLLCHQDGDPAARGLCSTTGCIETPPVSRACWRERCEQEVTAGCTGGGRACDASFLRAGQTEFVHEGFCADVGGTLDCVTTGHVCRAADGSFHDDCGDCADGDACDATLTDGAFDGSYGECAAGACTARVYPTLFDWRDHQGGDWTTPVANQQQVGACTVFGAVSGIEAKWNIQNGDPSLDINLSEQDPVSCGGWSLFGSRATLSYAEATGIPDETCFPWQNDETAACDDRCGDVADRRWRIAGFTPVESYREHPRLALMREGPVVVNMKAGGMVKDASGIYYCPSNTGGHAVAVVGWNDLDGYWIVKNSWGAAWNAAEKGFFRLHYGECSLSFEYTVDGVIAP